MDHGDGTKTDPARQLSQTEDEEEQMIGAGSSVQHLNADDFFIMKASFECKV